MIINNNDEGSGNSGDINASNYTNSVKLRKCSSPNQI